MCTATRLAKVKVVVTKQKHALGSVHNVCMVMSCDSLLAKVGDVGGDLVFAVHDPRECLTGTAVGKGGMASDQHEQDHTETPHI